MSKATYVLAAGAVLVGSGVAAAGGSATDRAPGTTADVSSVASSTPGGEVARLVDVGGRELYLQCAGDGSPMILLGAGDQSGVDEWQPVFSSLAAEARTCAYDRAGIGRSVEATDAVV